MTKKDNKSTSNKEVKEMTAEEVKQNKDILDDLKKIDLMFADSEPVDKKVPSKAAKAKSTKAKAKEAKPSVPKQAVDPKLIDEILKDLPEVVKTKDLNIIFDFNDGGKYLRRHLRSKFAEGHEHGEAWVWTKDDKQLMEILEYFANILTPEVQEKLVAVGDDVIKGAK